MNSAYEAPSLLRTPHLEHTEAVSNGDEYPEDLSSDKPRNDRDVESNRLQIYRYIENNPGAHLRKISKELGLAMGDTQYHLDILEKSGKVRSRKINLYRRYYSASILGEKEEIILAFLRQETARDILIYLMEYPHSTQSDLADFKHYSSPTISWHMSRLIQAGIVSKTKEGKKLRYSINEDRDRLIYILKTYHPSIWNVLASRLADIFHELSSSSQAIKEIARDKDEENSSSGVT
jgi:DNA-binding MarR family transcriptional regulator